MLGSAMKPTMKFRDFRVTTVVSIFPEPGIEIPTSSANPPNCDPKEPSGPGCSPF